MKKYPLLFLVISVLAVSLASGSLAEQKTFFRAYGGPLTHQNDDAEELFDTGIAYGFELVWDIQIRPSYSLELTGGFNFYSDDFSAAPGAGTPSVDLDIFSTTLSLRNKFKLSKRVYFNAGGGFGGYFSEQELGGPGAITKVEDDVFGLHFLTGLDIVLTENLFLLGEFRYTFTGLELEDENINYITFFFGVGIRL